MLIPLIIFFLSHSVIDASTAQLPPGEGFEEKISECHGIRARVIDLLRTLDTLKATGRDGIGSILLYEAGPSIDLVPSSSSNPEEGYYILQHQQP